MAILRGLILSIAFILSGSHALYSSVDTPTLTLTNRVDQTQPGPAVSLWNIHLSNIEPGAEVSIEVANHVGRSTPLPGRYTVDADGMVQINSGPITAILGSCFWGESFTFIAKSIVDGREIAKATIVPFPIQASDGKGHAVEVMPKGIDGEVFQLAVSGFNDDEDIDIHSTSEGEQLNWKVKGKVIRDMIMCPSVIGKENGTVTMVFNKDLKVSWRWGIKSTAPVDRIDWLRACEARNGL